MATRRRRYFLVADKIQHEPWSNDILAMVVRLMAHLHERWSRDGLSAEEACECVIGRGDMMRISGKHRVDVAVMSLRCLADVASISVRHQGDVIEIKWPKFAEFQIAGARPTPVNCPTDAPSDPDPDPDPVSFPKRKRKAREEVVIPEWLDADLWMGFVDHRKSVRSPLTLRAMQLTIAELGKLREQGEDLAVVIGQSIQRGWKGVFPVEQNGRRQSGRSTSHANQEAIHNVLAEVMHDDT